MASTDRQTVHCEFLFLSKTGSVCLFDFDFSQEMCSPVNTFLMPSDVKVIVKPK